MKANELAQRVISRLSPGYELATRLEGFLTDPASLPPDKANRLRELLDLARQRRERGDKPYATG